MLGNVLVSFIDWKRAAPFGMAYLVCDGTALHCILMIQRCTFLESKIIIIDNLVMCLKAVCF